MSDEIKVTNENESKCFCKSKVFRKFLVIALGTFVGTFCALSLFAALHRPPMMRPMHHGCPMARQHYVQVEHGKRHDNFNKKFHAQPAFEKKLPQEAQKPKIDD